MNGRLDLRETAEGLRRQYGHLLTAPAIAQAPEAAQPLREALEEARERALGRREPAAQLSLDVGR